MTAQGRKLCEKLVVDAQQIQVKIDKNVYEYKNNDWDVIKLMVT